MAPKKKSGKAFLKEEEKPEIALDVSEEELKENTEALEKAEALKRTIRELIGSENDKEQDDKTTSLSKIEGIGVAYENILKEHGITSVQELLRANAESLSKKTRFSTDTILEWQERGRKLVGKAEKTERKEPKREEKPCKEEDVKQNINKVKAQAGVIGYILRNTKSASIDLKDPTKVIDYAIMSSSTLEASEELSKTFKLGDVKHVLVEGNNAKLLFFTVGENKVSVFMEKNVDHHRIYKDVVG